MTVVAVGFAIGAASSALVWLMVREVFAHPTLARTNVRGIEVPTAGGIVMALALLPAWAATSVLVAETDLDVVPIGLAGAFGSMGAVLAFALLGLVDDVLARGDERGFRGHLGALRHGRLTTGGIKLVGGGLVALAVAPAGGPLWEILLDAAVIALATNLANLFDRAPGRVTKVSVLALLVLVVTAGSDAGHHLPIVALVVGSAVGLVGPELRERVMLGDTGANPLGAVLGLGVVWTTGPLVTGAVLVALVALNLASEKVSFSTVISSNPALRWVDQLGRVRP